MKSKRLLLVLCIVLLIAVVAIIFVIRNRKSYEDFVDYGVVETFIDVGQITTVYAEEDIDKPVVKYLQDAGYSGVLGRNDISEDSLCSDKILEYGVDSYWTLVADDIVYEIVNIDGNIYMWEAE